MKESNYNRRSREVKQIFWLFAILLFITLLRSQILSYKNLAFDSNPAIRQADNTQTQELTFFSSAPMLFSTPAAGLPPAGLQVDSNQFIRAAKIENFIKTQAGGRSGQMLHSARQHTMTGSMSLSRKSGRSNPAADSIHLMVMGEKL